MKDIVVIANFCRDFSKNDNGRFTYICKLLSKQNKVEIITSDFSHAKKKQKEPIINIWPFNITFLHEPGYKKNVSLKRFKSHFIWGKSVKKYLYNRDEPDVVYCAIPSLTAAYEASKYCRKKGIKFIIDIQDLWPEAFKMVFDIPIVSDILFLPFSIIANAIYRNADSVVAVSSTYVERAARYSKNKQKGETIFLGTDLMEFDLNCKSNNIYIEKGESDIWLGYCGSLSKSYDIECVLNALKVLLDDNQIVPKFIIMGDGDKKNSLKNLANKNSIDVEFMGKLEYPDMCHVLSMCDIVVNPIVKGSAASIINKHGDYAASGKPVINTQESIEYRKLIEQYNMGENCVNGDYLDVAKKIKALIDNQELRALMGKGARLCAEEKFDRARTYRKIVDIIER